jgi:hypothetical protein
LVVLHSPVAQGEMDLEETVFETVLPLGNEVIVCCHAPLAQVMGCEWFPVPMDVEGMEPHRRGPRAIPETIRVGLWNVRGVRKNSWTQIMACRELARISGRAVALHTGITPSSLHLALGGEVQFVPAPFVNRAAYYERMALMDITLQVSHAESFNYCAAESWSLGVPCLVGPSTPAGRFGMESAFVVDDPTDPVLMAQMMWRAIQDNAQEWWHAQMTSSVGKLIDYRHKALRGTLDALARGAV